MKLHLFGKFEKVVMASKKEILTAIKKGKWGMLSAYFILIFIIGVTGFFIVVGSVVGGLGVL